MSTTIAQRLESEYKAGPMSQQSTPKQGVTRTESRQHQGNQTTHVVDTFEGSKKYHREEQITAIPGGGYKKSYVEKKPDRTSTHITLTVNRDGSTTRQTVNEDADGNRTSSSLQETDAKGQTKATHEKYDSQGNTVAKNQQWRNADGKITRNISLNRKNDMETQVTKEYDDQGKVKSTDTSVVDQNNKTSKRIVTEEIPEGGKEAAGTKTTETYKAADGTDSSTTTVKTKTGTQVKDVSQNGKRVYQEVRTPGDDDKKALRYVVDDKGQQHAIGDPNMETQASTTTDGKTTTTVYSQGDKETFKESREPQGDGTDRVVRSVKGENGDWKVISTSTESSPKTTAAPPAAAPPAAAPPAAAPPAQPVG